MIPCLTLTEDRGELHAQRMVCSYLVRACRQALYELAIEEQSSPNVRHRAIQVLRVVHNDWLEALKAVAGELDTLKDAPDPARPSTLPRQRTSSRFV